MNPYITCEDNVCSAFIVFWCIVGIVLIMILGPLLGLSRGGETPYWKVIMAEAVSEGERGMTAVALVIRNRGGDINGFMGAKRPDLDSFVKRQGQRNIRLAKEIQQKVFEGNLPDFTGGATNFENIPHFGVPYWAPKMIVTYKYKQHTFFKRR